MFHIQDIMAFSQLASIRSAWLKILFNNKNQTNNTKYPLHDNSPVNYPLHDYSPIKYTLHNYSPVKYTLHDHNPVKCLSHHNSLVMYPVHHYNRVKYILQDCSHVHSGKISITRLQSSIWTINDSCNYTNHLPMYNLLFQRTIVLIQIIIVSQEVLHRIKLSLLLTSE